MDWASCCVRLDIPERGTPEREVAEGQESDLVAYVDLEIQCVAQDGIM